MKIQNALAFVAVLFSLVSVPFVHADDDHHGHDHNHDHDHAKKEAGPNGGRLITSIDPHAEFLVTKERKVKITFVDDKGNVVAPAGQIVEVTTGQRSAPVKLTFEKIDSALISDQAIPEGNRLPTVVQIRKTPESKAIIERFHLDLAHCSGCDLAEYACTCDH